MVPTYVGYPKDNVSEELLGNQPLFGEMALKHRLSVELIRPLAHGVIQTDGKYKNNKYVPTKSFHGMYECFDVNIKND